MHKNLKTHSDLQRKLILLVMLAINTYSYTNPWILEKPLGSRRRWSMASEREG